MTDPATLLALLAGLLLGVGASLAIGEAVR